MPRPLVHKVRIPDEVAALLRGLHPVLKAKAKAALKDIAANPNAGKALKDELEGLSSYRVGRFRVVYRISPRRQVEIVAVGPRKRIYQETSRILAKETRSASSR